MKKIFFLWSRLTATFWFVPSLVIVIALILVACFLKLDSVVNVPTDGFGRFLFVNSLESARSLLTTISGAMIGVAGTVFSMTLVALSLTSSQLGSRQIKNFMYDRINQVVLGSYISTFVCCIIILNVINKFEGNAYIPYLTIMFATFLAIANVILLIVFIHHIAVSIQADTVVSEISQHLSKSLNTLFPESLGEQAEDDWDDEKFENELQKYKITHNLNSRSSGYIQYIDSQALLEKTKEYDVLLKLDCKPGDYTVKDVQCATIYSNEILGEDDLNNFKKSFVTGDTRTTEQDAEHSIHQLVEIAARALSPGINDPYTAIACVDNLTKSLVYLSKVKFPSKFRLDAEGNLRIVTEILDFEGVLNAAFNQIRQFSKDVPSVVIRMMESLITIHKFIDQPENKEAIKKHATMLLNMGKNHFIEPNDVEDLERRAKLILE
ncbi:DUF2254 domain-containing protein [Winogradskyella litorisediminis]|uniref:DUF2254 domain-containing protein n=1 Tax=Winogradskyella litorisediminis TaxID=1156618 RepID=A0ABW3ND15_9FLAO